MAQFVGEEFDGVISGVTQFGIFVELDNGVEGLVHVSTMVNDFYEYREDLYAMVGERTNAQYRLGDPVQILLVRANLEERNLDFVLKDNGAYDPTAMRNAVRGGRKGKKSEEQKKETRGEGTREKRGHSQRGKGALDSKGVKNGKDAHRPDEGRASARGEKKGGRPPRGEKNAAQAARRKERTPYRDLGVSTRERGDYHRVKVTGLNSAVWPDPPGYHAEQSRREEAERAEQAKSAPRRRPRPHRKTESGTGNAK